MSVFGAVDVCFFNKLWTEKTMQNGIATATELMLFNRGTKQE